MADIFGSTEENNYIDVTKRDSAAESMKMVIAGTGGYSGKNYDGNTYLDIDKIRENNEKLEKTLKNNYNIRRKYEEELYKTRYNNLSSDPNIEKEKEEKEKEINNKINEINVNIDNTINEIENNTKLLYTHDTEIQLDPNNLVSSETEHRIHDGQKRFKTLGKTTSSKYPRPKTLFKVFFESNKDMGPGEPLCNELSKFVMSVTKPDVQYTTKEMNQYNRKKYIIEGVKYGQLKITFIDVKDNPIQQAFFTYLRKNNNDFKEGRNEENYKKYKENNITHFDDTDWGLNIDSSKHMFDSIIIYEMFLNRLMVYKIENPTLKSVSFGENKMGDYGYNEITVSFEVEGITNILEYTSSEGITLVMPDKDIFKDQIVDMGGAELAHFLGMRWYQGSGASDKEDNDNNFINVLNSYDNAGIRNYSIQKTKDLLSKVNENIELEDYINEIDKSFKMGNNASQYNWFAEAGYYSDNQQQVLQAGYSSKDYGYTGPRKTYYELSRNNEELAELGRANDSEYSSGNALDALLGVVKNPQDVSKMFSPRIKQLTDYFKF